jgi:hypothetical protein
MSSRRFWVWFASILLAVAAFIALVDELKD